MTDLLSEDELAGLKALADAATPGPWYHPCLGIIRHDGSADPNMGVVDIGSVGDYRDKELLPWNKERWDADAAFIAAARQAIPALLHHIDALKAELAREEKSHSITIDARDLAEDALSEIWCNVFGGDPNWSNLYGFPNAVNDIEAQFEKLRSQAATARTSALKEAAEVAKNKQDKTFTPSWNDACVHIERAILAIAEVK